jgi:hypothetical protein
MKYNWLLLLLGLIVIVFLPISLQYQNACAEKGEYSYPEKYSDSFLPTQDDSRRKECNDHDESYIYGVYNSARFHVCIPNSLVRK